MKLAELYVELRASGVGRVQAALKGVHARLKAVQASMVKVAATARKAFLITAAVIGASVYAASKFEDQLAMVSTMLDKSTMKYMKKYEAGLKSLAKQFGESTSTLAKGLYDILSASVAPAKAMEVLRVSAIAARAGFTSTAQSADVITTVLNSYKLSADNAAMVSDKLFSTVKRGKITFAQLAGSLGKAAATAAIAGLSLDELLAAVSTITRAGIKSDQAMTAVVGAIRSFISPTNEAEALADDLGFAMDTATLKGMGLAGVLEKIAGMSAKNVAILFPNIRGLKGIAAAMQDTAGYTKDLNMVMNSSGMAQEAFAKATATFSFKMAQLKQEIIGVGKTLGEYFIPFVSQIANVIKGLIKSFNGLSEGTKKIIAKFLVFTLVSSALIMIIPSVIKGLMALLTVFTLLVAHPVGAAIIGIIFVLGLLIKKTVEANTTWTNVWAKFINFLDPVIAAVTELTSALIDGILRAFNAISGSVGPTFTSIWQVISKIASFIRDVYVSALVASITVIKNWGLVWSISVKAVELALYETWDTIKWLFGTAIPYTLGFFFRNWKGILSDLVVLQIRFWKWIFKGFWELLKKVGSFLAGAFKKIWKWIKEDAYEDIKKVGQRILDAFVWAIKKVKELFTALWNWITGKGKENEFSPEDIADKITSGKGKQKLEIEGDSFDFSAIDLDKPFKSAIKESFKIPDRVISDRTKKAREQLGKLGSKFGKLFNQESDKVHYKAMWERFKRNGKRFLEASGEAYKAAKDKVKGFIEKYLPGGKTTAKGQGPKDTPSTAKAGAWVGLADVWKNIQSAALKDNVPKQQLSIQKKMNLNLATIVKNTSSGGGSPVGP